MSAPNAAFALAHEDREPYLPVGDHAPAPAAEAIVRADPFIGPTIESAAIMHTLAAAVACCADMQTARVNGSTILYRSAAVKLANLLGETDLKALSRHFAKAVTAATTSAKGE